MRNYLLLLGLMLGMVTARAQFTFGIKGGLNTTNVAAKEIEISNLEDVKTLAISFRDANYGMHFGFYMQGQISKFIIRPEVMFSSNKVNYNVKEFATNTIINTVKSETYQNLDLPVMLGVKLGALRLMGGPVGHLFIANKSELKDFSSYSEKFNNMTYGYQLGLGLDAGRLSIDGRYEGNFANARNGFTFYGHDYEFSRAPSRFIVSIGFRF